MRKIILLLGIAMALFMLPLASAWSPSLTDKLNAYYSMSSASESTGQQSSTYNIGGTTLLNQAGGIINGGANVSGSTSYSIADGLNVTELRNQNSTINMWIKLPSGYSCGGIDHIFASKYNGGGVGYYLETCFDGITDTAISAAYVCDADAWLTASTGLVNDGSWNMITLVVNATSSTLFTNGAYQTSCARASALDITTVAFTLGSGLPATSQFDELGLWNRSLTPAEISLIWNSGSGDSPVVAPTVSLISPTNGAGQISQNITLNISATPFLSDLKNVTFNVWNSALTLVNSSVRAFSGTSLNYSALNLFNLSTGTYTWNAYVCTNNTGFNPCAYASSNYSFSIGYVEKNISYNNQSYETASENFIAQISWSGSSVSTAQLIFDGTSYTANVYNLGAGNFTINKTIDLPASAGSKSWYFNMTLSDGSNLVTTTKTTNVVSSNLTLCGSAPQNYPYINFTFKNESSGTETINGALTAAITYWLGSGTTNKTLSFTNATNNLAYAFCFNPQNRTINVLESLSYYNSVSEQRSYVGTATLTNTTTNHVLYLLSTVSGIYSRYATVNNAGDVVQSVFALVQKIIGSGLVTVASGYTDSAGLITFFLDPLSSYTYTFTKSGYPVNTFSLYPTSSDTYTVVMGQTGATVSNGTQLGVNMTFQILPSNSSLLNNTSYFFAFNTTGEDITYMYMNLTNETGDQLFFGSLSGEGIVSTTLNTGNNTKFIYGKFYINTTEEQLGFNKVWVVGDYYTGSYSIFKQFLSLNGYGFANYWTWLFSGVIIFGVVFFLSTKQILERTEEKIIVITILVWMLSVVEWLNLGISQTGTLSVFGNQYGIAILTTAGAIAFIGRRVIV